MGFPDCKTDCCAAGIAASEGVGAAAEEIRGISAAGDIAKRIEAEYTRLKK